MKRMHGRFAAICLSIGAGPIGATAEEIFVTAASGHPPVFRWVRMFSESFEPAVNRALAGTGHSFGIDGQYGGAIAGVGEELETVGAGLAEIGTCWALFDPSKLAVQNVTYYTPFVSDDTATVSRVIDDMHRNDPRMVAAYTKSDVVYLGAPIVIDDYLLMTNFPVVTLADLDGRKIATPGAAINWLSGTGAVGVSGDLTTFYNELETGVYDGVITFASAALPGKLHEVAPHITQAGLGAQFAGAICANGDWYEGQPKEVRQALVAGADEAGAWYLATLNAAVERALTDMQKEGATLSSLPADARMDWAGRMENAAKSWAAELDEEDLHAAEILVSYMDAMRAAGATPLRDWDKE